MTATSIWQSAGFRAYLGSTAFTGIAFSMQQILVAWLLVGVLLLPGDRVGIAQALITTAGGLMVGIPAMIFYAYFRGHTSKLIARLETVAAELMPLLMRVKKQ